MSIRPLGAGPWLAAAAVAAVCARAGVDPRIMEGLAAGFAIGAGYVWLLWRRTVSLPGLPPRRAVLVAQSAAALRFCFVFLGFWAATRVWPAASIAWGVGSFVLPVTAGIVVTARGG